MRVCTTGLKHLGEASKGRICVVAVGASQHEERFWVLMPTEVYRKVLTRAVVRGVDLPGGVCPRQTAILCRIS